MSFLSGIFGRRVRLPRDHVTRVPRAAKRKAADALARMTQAIDDLGAMPGIADIAAEKRVPRGFYDKVDEFVDAYDEYERVASEHMGIAELPRPGTPEGTDACYAAPMGVSALEALRIYRKVRTWPDFPQVAEALQAAGQQQIEDIQALHTGRDPEKIPSTSRAIGQGRRNFEARKIPCPLLDVDKGRCRVWDARPINCRMHRIDGDVALADPAHPDHGKARGKNIRLPIRQQAAVSALEKRMALQLNPMLYAAVLQLGGLADAELIQEVGEAPRRMGQDGRVAQKANRNVRHAKKFQKGKKGKKRKK